MLGNQLRNTLKNRSCFHCYVSVSRCVFSSMVLGFKNYPCLGCTDYLPSHIQVTRAFSPLWTPSDDEIARDMFEQLRRVE